MPPVLHSHRLRASLALLFASSSLILAGCNDSQSAVNTAPKDPEVGVVTLALQSTTLKSELAGRTAAQMVVAAPVLALMTQLHGEGWIRPGIDALAIGSLVYLAVFGSIVGFGAYVYLLDKVRPAIATSYAYVNPPIAVLFGVMLGGEALHARDLVAMAIILAGVVLITWKR